DNHLARVSSSGPKRGHSRGCPLTRLGSAPRPGWPFFRLRCPDHEVRYGPGGRAIARRPYAESRRIATPDRGCTQPDSPGHVPTGARIRLPVRSAVVPAASRLLSLAPLVRLATAVHRPARGSRLAPNAPCFFAEALSKQNA